jgi:hypothetical protein
MEDSPFKYTAKDRGLDKETAVQYIPPNKRHLIKEYLSRSSVKFSGYCKQKVQSHPNS